MNRDQTSTTGRRPSRLRDALTATGIVAAVGVIAGGSVLAGAVGAAFGRDTAISSAGVLAIEQATADKLPGTFPASEHGTGGIDLGSARFLGEQSGSRYWIALDRAANVCLVVQSARVAVETAASCVSAAELEASGAALRVDGTSWRLDAVLIPDSVDESTARGAWVAIDENLVVLADPAAGSAPLELTREAGESGDTVTLEQRASGTKG